MKKAKECGTGDDSGNNSLTDSGRAELERSRAENAELRMQVAFAKKVGDLVRERPAGKFGAIADNECPPKSKKPSSIANRETPSTAPNNPAEVSSTGDREPRNTPPVNTEKR